MTKTTWVEVALNGPWGRDKQPLMPISVEEIVEEGLACAAAGAAILHVHAYDVESGRQKDDWQTYARIIEGIQSKADVIVYPSLPMAGGPNNPDLGNPGPRYAAVEELAKRGLAEWQVIDPGSVNFSHQDDRAAGRGGFAYRTPERDMRYGLEPAERYGFHPCYALYEPGFGRLGAALSAEYPKLPQPIYRLFFSDGFAFGFPATRWALTAYHRLLSELVPEAPWMVAGLAVDIRPVISGAIERGGHVRVGMEDAPFGTERSNLDWLEEVVARVRAEGSEPATAAEVRAALA